MSANIDVIKRRFNIVGFDPALERAIDVAVQVAPTDLSVLITGESGVGKESFPRIIHEYSKRKHGEYIAVNCGAIPEGTIDSELFGHEKGAYTGAVDNRKGYFETANGGTIFLDEVADLPMATQVRLLRVLENHEFIRVGSSDVQQTNVRVVAATNVDLADRIAKGKFRPDLYFRLCSVTIHLPALRERKDDIYPLFLKFAGDFATKYQCPALTLTEDAIAELRNYRWPGNIRQLKNVTEQVSILEKDRHLDAEKLKPYLSSPVSSNLPALVDTESESNDNFQREIIFKFIAELQREIAELKAAVHHLANGSLTREDLEDTDDGISLDNHVLESRIPTSSRNDKKYSLPYHEPIIIEDDDLSLGKLNEEAIIKALERNHNNKKLAAEELKISERTIYRKIKEYKLNEKSKE